MVDFGERLKELRTQANLTQVQLAERIGVTKSAISYYELLERSPSPDIIVKLAAIFHVSTDYLLGVKRTQTIDVSDLDEESVQLLLHTISVLRNKRR